MGLKRVMWVRRYQGQCRALRPLGHQGYRLRNHKKDQPLCSGYIGAVDGRCWDRLARSSGLLYPAWVLSAVRRGKQRQFVCWIKVRSTDGKVKLARCLIDNGSEVNLVRKGFLQEDETKMSSTPVQLEGVSGHRLDGGDREAELAVRLVKQSVWSVEEMVTEE